MDLTAEDVKTFLKGNWKWIIPIICFLGLLGSGLKPLHAGIVGGALLYGFYQPKISIEKKEEGK